MYISLYISMFDWNNTDNVVISGMSSLSLSSSSSRLAGPVGQAELMAQDLDTVLQVVPKVEDTMLKTTGHLQEPGLNMVTCLWVAGRARRSG